MVIHNFITVDETGYMLLVMAENRVGNPQKLKTDLAITIQPLTLSWVEADSLYKTNTVIKLEVKVNDGPDLVHRLPWLDKEICRQWDSNQCSLFPKATASTRSTALAT